MANLERYKYDVVVIGAGGAGLRAAVEAREAGLKVAIICKSLSSKSKQRFNQVAKIDSKQIHTLWRL